MSFKPYDLSVNDIFSGNRRYKIPNYQREFSWENENFDDFYNDLIKSSKLSLENTDINIENKYFFGTILLLGVKESPDYDIPYEVIDGQQRLTTMTLFFAAIQDIIRNISTEYKTDFDERLFCKVTKSGQYIELERLVNNSLIPVLPVTILNLNNLKNNGAKPNPDSYEKNWLLNAFEYIKKLLSKESFSVSLNIDINSIDDNIYLKLLDGLGKHLSNSTLICIYHTNKAEANILFRNLNYRGKPLSQVDLIKNEIFSIVEDSSKYASKTWKEIEDNVYESGENIFHRFLYHYMYGRYSKITKNNITERFLSNVRADKDSYVNFLEELKTASEYYKIILKPEDSDNIFGMQNYFKNENNMSIKRNLEFFKYIDVSQCRILLITLFECRKKDIIENKFFKEFIELIAQHQCLHVLVSSSPNKLTSIYAKASKDLVSLSKKKKSEHKKGSKEIYNTLKKELIAKLPDKNLVIDSKLNYSGKPISEMKVKERKEHVLIKFILQRLSVLEQDEDTNRANDGLKFIYDSTIEHIIDKDSKGESLYSLGNLLLLERDVHQDIKILEQKKEMYENSKITKTRKFFKEYVTFDEKRIPEREKKILESYYNLVSEIKQ